MIKNRKSIEKRMPLKNKRYQSEESRVTRSNQNALSKVNEPAIFEYGLKKGIGRWLGIPTVMAQTIRSDFDIVKLGISGITKSSINSLAAHIGISRKNMAEDIFDVSIKTFERKDDKDKLDKKTSSHAIEIAKVVQHAYEVFRDESKLKLWINRENKALNNLKPVQLFDTLSGLNMVNDILGRIEYGVYS